GHILAIAGDEIPGFAADAPEHAQPGSNWVQLLAALLALPQRPWCYLLASGDIAVTGPERTARLLDPTGNGNWSIVGDMLLGSRHGGTSVLVPGSPDRILIMGGRNPATETCEVLDLQTTFAWQSTSSLAHARRHHHATILADGTVLVTGGTFVDDELLFAVHEPELYDPLTEAWTTLDSMSVPRRRGSIALLLPDARVLCAGGGDGSPGSELHADAEIFSPPYLFRGARPAITSAPDSVVYASSFIVGSPEALNVDAVWLVRAGTVSGGFDADQRALPLPFTTAAGELTVTAPDSANLAPPGMYMLFVVDDSGVPSIAELLRLHEGAPFVPPPNITSSPTLNGTVGELYLYPAQASGTPPITWSLPQAPGWLAVNGSNGIVSGVPTVAGSFPVTLRADNAGGFDEQNWTLEIDLPLGTPQTIIPLGANWRYFKGTSEPGSSWADLGYDDSAWLVGPSGFGYGDWDDATVLIDMRNNYSTVYTRHTFELYNLFTVSQLALLYEHDDGLAVYLNGTRIFSRNAPDTVAYTSTATGAHEAGSTLIRAEFTDGVTLGLFQEGTNVLAAVGLNVWISSSDFTLKVELEVTGGTTTPTDVSGNSTVRSRFLPAHPNPFVSSARVGFALARPGPARLDVYDVAGRRVRTITAPRLPPGTHLLEWDGSDRLGRAVAPGVYFYRLRTPETERHGKLIRTFAETSGRRPAR
ncbi:MAG: galactose oxidase-like domain-containing protein, partial [Candidatus Krumholzibacteriia bacterium]